MKALEARLDRTCIPTCFRHHAVKLCEFCLSFVPLSGSQDSAQLILEEVARMDSEFLTAYPYLKTSGIIQSRRAARVSFSFLLETESK